MRYDFNFSARRHRRSIRRADHDYGWRCTYFVTIVTDGRFCWFGDVVDGAVELNPLGDAVLAEWLKGPELRLGVELGEFVLMPNHLHGIVSMPGESRGWQQPALEDSLGRKVVSKSLGALVRGFKAAATGRVNRIRQLDEPGELWQRNYHEHIVRDAADLKRIEHYIRANPARWVFDPENVEARPDSYERAFWKSLDE